MVMQTVDENLVLDHTGSAATARDVTCVLRVCVAKLDEKKKISIDTDIRLCKTTNLAVDRTFSWDMLFLVRVGRVVTNCCYTFGRVCQTLEERSGVV